MTLKPLKLLSMPLLTDTHIHTRTHAHTHTHTHIRLDMRKLSGTVNASHHGRHHDDACVG